MSNSTRQGGQDERLVVPLEASRRGAHRARTNPLVAALPLLVVVVVVAAVIGVAYALFLKPSGDTRATDPLASPTASTASTASSASSATSAPSTTTQRSATSSSSPASSSSTSSSPTATVNKSIAITVYNGTLNNGTRVDGLARTTSNVLAAAKFTKATFTTAAWTATPISQTTVFYSKDSQAATAEAIVKVLGVGKAEKSSSTGGGIGVVAYSDLKR